MASIRAPVSLTAGRGAACGRPWLAVPALQPQCAELRAEATGDNVREAPVANVLPRRSGIVTVTLLASELRSLFSLVGKSLTSTGFGKSAALSVGTPAAAGLGIPAASFACHAVTRR
ncbi:hypothetical protein J2X16_000778 [Pelomonas aquatica]|uniref:Uncharacterized protein n=1 Tax=Pelomonas aquatica TaxID=431058 RepID=A0ABU1Z4B5_9BURK|nr:hypothetical protein [Pelomonas aquatica]MDR7295457.1 hypothetical protein [Pelomonas aquatica]